MAVLVVAVLVATSFVALVGVAFLGCGRFDQDPKLPMFRHRQIFNNGKKIERVNYARLLLKVVTVVCNNVDG